MYNDQITRYALSLRLEKTYFYPVLKTSSLPLSLFYLITTYIYYNSFCCEDNVTFCLHNIPKCFILLRKSKKISYGASILAPSALDLAPPKRNSWIRH
jgi:hypothetical protein